MTTTPPALYAAYTAPRRSAEADYTALAVIKTLHAQSGQPVTLAALAAEMLAMGLPPARRSRSRCAAWPSKAKSRSAKPRARRANRWPASRPRPRHA